VRSTSSGLLNILLLFLRFLLDCTLLFSLLPSSPLLFDYLPSAYLFSAQLWNILGIIRFPFVVTLVSRSNSLWSPSPHGVPKVFTFIYHNKLTSRIVSKPLIGLITLNQALICTPIPNLISVIQSESMISQAFQTYYFIEGCLSNCCILSHERVGYIVGNIHQLNLLPRLSLTHSRELHLQPQELLRWRQGPRRLFLSISTLRNIFEYYKC